jgi:hypothetical protein
MRRIDGNLTLIEGTNDYRESAGEAAANVYGNGGVVAGWP